MCETLKTPWFNYHEQPEALGGQGEHLNNNNPYARSVAEAVFKTGVICFGMLCRRGYQSGIHSPDCHDIRIMLQGNMTLIREGVPHVLRPGEIAYTLPGTERDYCSSPTEVTWWLYVKILDVPDWEGLKREGSYIEAYESATMMLLLLRKILDAFRSRNVQSMNEARSDSHVFLNYLRLLMNRKKQAPQRTETLREMVDEIARYPGDSWNQVEMAEKMHVCSRTLLRLSKSEYGCTPMEMVSQQRLNHALTLLTETNKVIAEVARRCGYENVSSFIRVFRKQIGTTPGQYRRSIADENRLEGI